MLVHILRHGMLVFLAQLHWMVSTREEETCHGRSGLTRFVFKHSYCLLSLIFYRFIWLHLPHQIGLEGEALSLHSLSGSSSVEWVERSLVAQRQPLTWYKVSISNINQSFLSFSEVAKQMYVNFVRCCLRVALKYIQCSNFIILDGEISQILVLFLNKNISSGCDLSQRWVTAF